MNSQDIFDGVTDIRDDLINDVEETPKMQKGWMKKRWTGVVAAVLVLAIVGGIFLRPGGELAAYAVAEAEYPEMAPYPKSYSESAYDAWWKDVAAQQRDLGDISSLQSFFARSAQTFLAEDEGNNRVYSPLNVYMALSMLAQLTDGESRGQILTLLDSDSTDSLRRQAGDVWNANYRDDGALTSILASSLWLDQKVKFNQETMDTLARDFYASSYRGEMGSEKFNKVLQSWLNEQTGRLLEEQAGNIKLDNGTILALATTVYFKAKWSYTFSKENTSPEIFHTSDRDVETDFMHQREGQTYYWGDRFAAVRQSFDLGGDMWFLLPDEGTTPEELLADEETIDFLFTADRNEWGKRDFLFINKSIPKFDVSSQFDLKEGLQALGITDVFEPEVSDFTPMTTDVDEAIAISQAKHAARVVIDEEGCTAAAFTVMAADGAAAAPNEEVDFVLDRPFIFCIMGESGLPLFVGVVNYPIGK